MTMLLVILREQQQKEQRTEREPRNMRGPKHRLPLPSEAYFSKMRQQQKQRELENVHHSALIATAVIGRKVGGTESGLESHFAPLLVRNRGPSNPD